MAKLRDERLEAWERDGYFVVPRALDRASISALAEACDHVLGQLRVALPESGHSSTHIEGLFAPDYYRDRPELLERLVEFVSSRSVVAHVADLGRALEGELSLRDAQYFHEPLTRDRDGHWHRDGDPVAAPSLLDERTWKRPTLLRYRVAFAPDDHLEYVVGSHRRPDTEEELRVRRAMLRDASLAGAATRIELQPGDVCVFDTWGIHRGRYRRGAARRTLDLLFGFGPRVARDYRTILKLAREPG